MCISKVTAFTIPLRFKICLVKTDIESVHISKDIQFNELFLTSTIETKFSPSLLSYILCDMKYVETPQPQEIKKKVPRIISVANTRHLPNVPCSPYTFFPSPELQG